MPLGFLKDVFKAPADTTEGAAMVEKVRALLTDMEEGQKDYTACFAFVMARIAAADLQISAAEMQKMSEILSHEADLSPAQAQAVAEIVKLQCEEHGATENYLVTRQFNQIASEEQKKQLLNCLFAVSAADDSICSYEELELKKIASELKISDGYLALLRSKYREARAVFQKS